MKKITILTFTILMLIGCHSESNMHKNFTDYSETSNTSKTTELMGSMEEAEMTPPKNSSQIKLPPEPIIEKKSKIIKNGKMRIEAEDISHSKRYIDSAVAKNNGYYENEIFNNSGSRDNYALKLRIPSANFYTVVKALEMGSGTIMEKNINAKDVTEEYLDLEIRLENNLAYLKRYKELLSKAKTIKEMIQIQEKIRQIEMLVDMNKGKIRYLNDRANYSSLTIELVSTPEEIVAEAPPGYFDKLFDALKNGYSGMLFFILIIVNFWPVILGLVIIWIFRKRMFGGVNQKKSISAN